MPIYDFQCTNEDCKHIYEKIVSKFNSDEDPVVLECPLCSSEARTIMPAGCRSKVKFLFNYLVDN